MLFVVIGTADNVARPAWISVTQIPANECGPGLVSKRLRYVLQSAFHHILRKEQRYYAFQTNRPSREIK
jgi:hypothetical protein